MENASGAVTEGSPALSGPDADLLFACGNPLVALPRIQDLVAAGASIHARHPLTGETPLLVSFNRRRQDEVQEILEFLLSKGADAKAVNGHGMNALHYAVKHYFADLVTFLIRLGVPMEQVCANGYTPLRQAVEDAADEIIDLLLDAGAWPRTVMPSGEDLLECETVQALLSRESLERLRSLQQQMPSLGDDEDELEEEEVADEESGPRMDLYQYEHLGDVDIGDQVHLAQVIQGLSKAPNTRLLAQVTQERIEAIEALQHKFPNFREVIGHLCNRLKLCRLSPTANIYIKPILLISEPGAGKSKFVRAVARVLGVPLGMLQGESISSSTTVTGISSVFQGSKYGKVFETLRHSKYGNPVMFFDELDKATASDGRDPKSALLTLLVRETAREFRDEFLGFPVDASHLIWFCAVNDVNALPSPLLSRFTCFEIKQPSREEMPTVIRSIYRDLLDDHMDEWGAAFSPELPSPAMEALFGKSAREVSLMLEGAMGIAAARASAGAGPIQLCLEDFQMTPKRRQGIGFVGS